MIRAVVGLIVMITGGYLVARYYPSRLAIYVAAATISSAYVFLRERGMLSPLARWVSSNPTFAQILVGLVLVAFVVWFMTLH